MIMGFCAGQADGGSHFMTILGYTVPTKISGRSGLNRLRLIYTGGISH
jgi:hypothetical protein